MKVVRVFDPVEKAEHYNSSPAKCKCGERIECIDVVEHMSFPLGNTVKYIWRHEFKGDSLQDLRKGLFYLSREIKRLEKLQ